MGMEEGWGGMEEADVPVGAVCEGQGVGAGIRRPLDEREQKRRGKCDRVCMKRERRGRRLSRGLSSGGEGNGGCQGRRDRLPIKELNEGRGSGT